MPLRVRVAPSEPIGLALRRLKKLLVRAQKWYWHPPVYVKPCELRRKKRLKKKEKAREETRRATGR
jgi:hypothetical protein